VAALEVSIIAAPLLKLLDMQVDGRWSGSASRLLERLTALADVKVTRQREWPRQPHVLSGKLQRLAPALRRAGYTIEFGRDHNGRTVTLEKVRETASRASRTRKNKGILRDAPRDAPRHGSVTERHAGEQKIAGNQGVVTLVTLVTLKHLLSLIACGCTGGTVRCLTRE
jgi:hypothetical protein